MRAWSRPWHRISLPDAIDGVTVDDSDLMSDIHASAAYRANLIKVMAKRAVGAAG
jgi:carbon-monoxide dehydrogenase medium subunit